MSLINMLSLVQSDIDKAYLLACRCGRVEETHGDSVAKKEFTEIAELLREYASFAIKAKVKGEQVALDLARLNGKTLPLITKDDN